MSVTRKSFEERFRGWDEAVERLLAETGYTGSRDLLDPARRAMEGRLVNDFPWMTFARRWEILESGKSPYKIAKRDGRNGWSVKVKGEIILIEHYVAGQRDDRRTMTLALAEWPTTTHGWRPNLAFAQNEVLRLAMTAMVRRVFPQDNSSESIIQVARDCDAIRAKIRELVADDWPFQPKQKKSKQPPKAKIIATPGEAEKNEPSYCHWDVRRDIVIAVPIPQPEPTP